MLSLIITGEAFFLLPFILARVFKPVIRDAFLISDAQIGGAQALYGITAVVSYFFGGLIAAIGLKELSQSHHELQFNTLSIDYQLVISYFYNIKFI